MTIQENHVVEFNYTLKDGQDQVIDSSEMAGSPMAYIHGQQNILPKLEAALTGKAIGDSLNIELAAADAYGPRQEEMIQTIPRDQFPEPENIQVGMQFQVQTQSGHPLPVVVTKIVEEGFVLDGNHPLAGIDLKFDVEITSIRVATEDEIGHGHLHMGEGCCGGDGEGGHCHDKEEKEEKSTDDGSNGCCGSCS